MTTTVNPIAIANGFARADWRSAICQLLNTLVPFGLLWAIAAYLLSSSPLLSLLACLLASGFYIRIFSIFHDCGHGSFFPSGQLNMLLGFLLGLFFFIPYHHWIEAHAEHHANAGNLDRRGKGDIWTLTRREYQHASLRLKLAYRFYRSPFGLFFSTMILGFIFLFRLPHIGQTSASKKGIWATNLTLVLTLGLLIWWVGLTTVLIVHGSIYLIGTAAGIFLIYVDHTFDGVYWADEAEWSFCRAAMEGSSFLKLPRVLQFLTGNVGYHHIHHLNSKIPNYLVPTVHNSHPIFSTAKTLHIWDAVYAFRLKLWDEQKGALCSFPSRKEIP